MKKKVDLILELPESKFWSKKTGERRDVDYIMLINAPENGEIKYAATISSAMDTRYTENIHNKIQRINLVKEGGERRLEIVLKDNDNTCQYRENFLIVFTYCKVLNNGKEGRDSILIYSLPKLLGDGVRLCVFQSDQKENNGTSLFWLCKEFF